VAVLQEKSRERILQAIYEMWMSFGPIRPLLCASIGDELPKI
jgi:hypothetical protein